MSDGPYGTNVGDIWLSEGSAIQERLDAEGKGMKLVHEVMSNLKTGYKAEECLYVTNNPEIIAEAEEGTKKYWEQKASEN